MALLIYSLCALAALSCAILLFQSWRKSRSGMLWWSGVCFFLLSLSNTALVVEDVLFQGHSLWPLRHGLSLAAISALLYGLIFEEH
jgi:hypothetical protein